MVNLRIIHKIIGALLTIEALMMAACLAISMYFGEDDTLAFGISVVTTVKLPFVRETMEGRAVPAPNSKIVFIFEFSLKTFDSKYLEIK